MADEKTEATGGKSADGKNLQKKRLEYHALKGRLFEVRRTLKSTMESKAELEGKIGALGEELGIKATGKAGGKAPPAA